VNSFAEVERYLGTVSAQAESLAAQEFDDPALDEDVPGAFGDSLDEMAANLEAYTTELESLVDAFGDAAGRARDGDLTATIDDGALATDEDRYVELVGNYNRLVTTLGGTVGGRSRRSPATSRTRAVTCARAWTRSTTPARRSHARSRR